MTNYTEDAANATAELLIKGKVTEEAFQHTAGRMEAFIERHGKIKVLEVLKDFRGFDASVLGKGVLGAVVSCEIKLFRPDEIDQARTWLREAS